TPVPGGAHQRTEPLLDSTGAGPNLAVERATHCAETPGICPRTRISFIPAMKSIMPSGRNGFPAIEPESVAEAINPQTPKETTGYLGDEPSLFLLMPFPALSL